jgi:hypothetical protein
MPRRQVSLVVRRAAPGPVAPDSAIAAKAGHAFAASPLSNNATLVTASNTL